MLCPQRLLSRRSRLGTMKSNDFESFPRLIKKSNRENDKMILSTEKMHRQRNESWCLPPQSFFDRPKNFFFFFLSSPPSSSPFFLEPSSSPAPSSSSSSLSSPP